MKPLPTLLAALLLTLALAGCGGDDDCPTLEESWDCVDHCSGMMTGPVCRDGEWECPDACPACEFLHPGEDCVAGESACLPGDADLQLCPEVMCAGCEEISVLATSTCACSCDEASDELRCERLR